MKRWAPVVGALLLSFGKNDFITCGFTPSHNSSEGGVVRISNQQRRSANGSVSVSVSGTRFHHYGNTHNQQVVCRMNKKDDAMEENSSKRGWFKRVRDRFADDKNDEDSESDGQAKIDYKPNALDVIRLRLAKAMSNINIFQLGKGEEWVVACPKTRVGPGQIIPCNVNGLDIIIFASRDGQRLDAFANACPHLGSPFDLATVERKPPVSGGKMVDDGTGDGCVDCVVCPVHQTAFEIQSGAVSGEWCPYPPVLGGIM